MIRSRHVRGACEYTLSPQATDRWVRLRVLIIGIAFIGFLVADTARAFQLQIHQQVKLKGLAQDQYVRQIEIPARRGDIFDRRGVAARPERRGRLHLGGSLDARRTRSSPRKALSPARWTSTQSELLARLSRPGASRG